jgi:hypothetical protein
MVNDKQSPCLSTTLTTTTHTTPLAAAAAGNRWNIRVVSALGASGGGGARPLFGVKLGTAFPARVACGDADTKLSLTLRSAAGAKLKAGRDWRLVSQSERRVERDGAVVTLNLAIDAAPIDSTVTLLSGRQDSKSSRKATLIQILAPHADDVAPGSAPAKPETSPTTAAVDAPQSPPTTPRNADATTTLPEGWKAVKTDDGRTYYYHGATRKVCFSVLLNLSVSTTVSLQNVETMECARGCRRVTIAARMALDNVEQRRAILLQRQNERNIMATTRRHTNRRRRGLWSCSESRLSARSRQDTIETL